MTSSVNSRVLQFSPTSLVEVPMAWAFLIGFSISHASFDLFNCLSIMALESIIAVGLAMSLPAMSTAEPWTGSKNSVSISLVKILGQLP